MTTCLIDTWGPMLFQNLMFPEDNAARLAQLPDSPSCAEKLSEALPRMLLMIFNLGDLCGLDLTLAALAD